VVLRLVLVDIGVVEAVRGIADLAGRGGAHVVRLGMSNAG
jgi:hypothetical protein